MEFRLSGLALLLAAVVWTAGADQLPPEFVAAPLPVVTNPPLDRLAEAHAHFSAGIVLDAGGKPDEALDELNQAALLDPENQALAVDVAERFLARKEPDKALEALAKVAERPDATADVLTHLGFVYARLGRLDDAIAANRRAVQKAPGELAGYQNLYLNLLQKDQSAEAREVLDQAVKVPGTGPEFLINLAELYANFARQIPSQKTNVYAVALKLLNRAARQPDMASPLRLKLGDGFNLLGEDARAKAIYQRLLGEFSESSLLRAGIRNRLAELCVRAGDRKGAIEQLQALVKDDPANVTVNLQLGELALEERMFDLAADCFRKVVLLRPEFEPTYGELAQAQLGQDKPKEALATLAEARGRFPSSYATELLTGIAYGRLKDYDQAIAHFTRAEVLGSASDPPRANEAFYFQFGSIYERKGDLAQAEHYIRKCLELAPDFADAQNYLGYMWAERGTNLPAARGLIEKAVKAEPANAAFLDSLAWVLFKQGHLREALSYQLKAIKRSDLPDPTLFDHLGDIYQALGRHAKARDAWEKSLKLEASEAIRKKLDSTPAR